jgi:hypothetical protein
MISLGPGFWELANDHNISNEMLGMITRCVVLGTDDYLTMDILPDVSLLRDEIEAREDLRYRVAKCRNRKSGGERNEDSSSSKKTPFKDTKKLPPIVPLEEPLESSPEKVQHTEGEGSGVVAGSSPVKEAISQGLFDFAGDAHPSKSRQTNAKAPPARRSDLGAATSAPAQSAPQGRSEASEAVLMSDQAWIGRCFANFWEMYPRKVAKAAAQKAFAKVMKTQSDPGKFMGMVRRSLDWWKSRPEWKKDNGKYIPYPATWINAGHWADAEDNQSSGDAEFLRGDSESDDELIKRMQGGG